MGPDSFILYSDLINLPLEKPMCRSAEAWIPLVPLHSPPRPSVPMSLAGRRLARRSRRAGHSHMYLHAHVNGELVVRPPEVRATGAKAGRSAFFGLEFLKTTCAIRINFVLVSVRPILVRLCETISRFTAGHFWCRPSPTTCVVSPSPITPLAHKAELDSILFSHIHSFLLSSVSPTATDKAQE